MYTPSKSTGPQATVTLTQADQNMMTWLTKQVVLGFPAMSFYTAMVHGEPLIESISDQTHGRYIDDRTAGLGREAAKARALKFIEQRLNETIRQPGFVTASQLDSFIIARR